MWQSFSLLISFFVTLGFNIIRISRLVAAITPFRSSIPTISSEPSYEHIGNPDERQQSNVQQFGTIDGNVNVIDVSFVGYCLRRYSLAASDHVAAPRKHCVFSVSIGSSYVSKLHLIWPQLIRFLPSSTLSRHSAQIHVIGQRRLSAIFGESGKSTYRILSIRLGRRTAGLTMSCRLVAAIKKTPFWSSIPSI